MRILCPCQLFQAQKCQTLRNLQENLNSGSKQGAHSYCSTDFDLVNMTFVPFLPLPVQAAKTGLKTLDHRDDYASVSALLHLMVLSQKHKIGK